MATDLLRIVFGNPACREMPPPIGFVLISDIIGRHDWLLTSVVAAKIKKILIGILRRDDFISWQSEFPLLRIKKTMGDLVLVRWRSRSKQPTKWAGFDEGPAPSLLDCVGRVK